MFPNLLASGQMLGTLKYSALYKLLFLKRFIF